MGVDRKVGEDKKRWIMSIRTTAAGRERLQGAAEAQGRSLSEEIEGRLRRTFWEDDSYGGFENAALVNLIGATIRNIEAHSERSWRTDPVLWGKVRDAVLATLESHAPAGAVKRPRIKASQQPSPEQRAPGD